jgi:hypothetical protein
MSIQSSLNHASIKISYDNILIFFLLVWLRAEINKMFLSKNSFSVTRDIFFQIDIDARATPISPSHRKL